MTTTTRTITAADAVLAFADARLDELGRYVRPFGPAYLDTIVKLDRALADLRDLDVASAIDYVHHARRTTFGHDGQRGTEASAIRHRMDYVAGFLAAADVVVRHEAGTVTA